MSLPPWHFQAVAAEYPRWPHETPIHYTERLSILAGAMPRERAVFVKPDEDIKAGVVKVAVETRLPFKDD